jgi:hypothetical protein
MIGILDLLTNRDKAQKMAETGKRVALRNFDERRIFKTVETEYARLIKAKDTSKSVGKHFNSGAKLVTERVRNLADGSSFHNTAEASLEPRAGLGEHGRRTRVRRRNYLRPAPFRRGLVLSFLSRYHFRRRQLGQRKGVGP